MFKWAKKVFGYHEAARPTRERSRKRSTRDGEREVRASGKSLRDQARYLDENAPVAIAVLDTLVNNVVGPNGIGVEYQPRRPDGSIHEEFARQLSELRRDWDRRPEVTWQHTWAECEKMAARSILRDGEVFAQELIGRVPLLDHGTVVPYSLEWMEADFVPLEMGWGANAISGIERNAWGKPVRYWVYKEHPQGDIWNGGAKYVPASRMIHAAFIKRFNQGRGISILGPVIPKIQDITEAENIEMVARKLAASIGIIEQTDGSDTTPTDYDADEPEVTKVAGATWFRTRPGAKIMVADTKRNTQELTDFIYSLKNEVAGATGTNASTVTRVYSGSYSAERQKAIEAFTAYAGFSAKIIAQISDPVNRRFIQMAIASGAITVPDDVAPESIDDAAYIVPQPPMIDLLKEMRGYEIAEKMGWMSGPEIIRKRGGNPAHVFQTETNWRDRWESAEHPLPFTIDEQLMEADSEANSED